MQAEGCYVYNDAGPTSLDGILVYFYDENDELLFIGDYSSIWKVPSSTNDRNGRFVMTNWGPDVFEGDALRNTARIEFHLNRNYDVGIHGRAEDCHK